MIDKYSKRYFFLLFRYRLFLLLRRRKSKISDYPDYSPANREPELDFDHRETNEFFPTDELDIAIRIEIREEYFVQIIGKCG